MRDRKPFFNLFPEVSAVIDGSLQINCRTFTETSKIEDEDYRVSFTLLCWLKYLLPSFNSSLKAGEVLRQAVIYKCNNHKQDKFPELNPINFPIASRTTKIMATIQVPYSLVFTNKENIQHFRCPLLGPTLSRCKYQTQFIRIPMSAAFF